MTVKSNLENVLRLACLKSGKSIMALAKAAKLPYASVHGFVRGGGLQVASVAKLAAALELELHPVPKRKQ